MYAYSNILAALLQRSQTGRGCRIDVSMLESMAERMSFPMYYAFEGAAPPQRNAWPTWIWIGTTCDTACHA